jgi:hypothetical protein
MFSMASSIDFLVEKVTKPNPQGRPVFVSLMILEYDEAAVGMDTCFGMNRIT